MRYFLALLGIVFFALFGLSAMATEAPKDVKHPVVALNAIMPPIGGRCMTSAAQAVSDLNLTIYTADEVVQHSSADQCAASGGGRLGVGIDPPSRIYI